jgi:hypothetical protein
MPASVDLLAYDIFLLVEIYQRRSFVLPISVGMNDLMQCTITAVESVAGICSGVFGANWIIVLIPVV